MDKSKKMLITKIVVISAVVLTVICVWTYHVRSTNLEELAVTTPDGSYVTDVKGDIVTVPRTEKYSAGATPGLGLFGEETGTLSNDQKYPVATQPGASMPNITPPGGNASSSKPSGGSGDIGTPGNPNIPSGDGSSDKPIIGWEPDDEVTTGKQPAPPELKTPAQIVAYFNQAANGVKTGKPGLDVKRATTMTLPGFPGGNIEPGVSNDSATYKKGTNLKNVFPVYGEDWSSKLTANGVKSAVCTQDGGKYKILIALKDEVNPNPKTSAHGQCFGVLDPKELEEAMAGSDGSCKNLSTTYSGSKISAVIDVKTGRMLSAKYYMRMNLRATMVSGAFQMPVNMQMDDVQEFTMTW